MDKNNYISREEKFSVLLSFFFRMRGKGVDNRTKLKVFRKEGFILNPPGIGNYWRQGSLTGW